eukprot:gene4042-5784_t
MFANENNVGILGMEVYFPSTYVKQVDLEVANNVSTGKYTIGLGQDAMAFTGDLEDINSISLTVVQTLLEKYSISPNEIGRLEIGTESLVDKSKSTKTILMSLFAQSGNTDVEGATVVNACYGGTAALLNALSWIDSNAWDGRFAIVVAADIAVYADGPARPSGGCGSVAMLLGRNAPLKIDLRTRTTHSTDVWDFFKPKMDSEYPEVNGALSQTCYLRALDDCYNRFIKKSLNIRDKKVTVNDTDYFLFHSPYNKLVQKSFARLIYQDMVNGNADSNPISKWLFTPIEKTYDDKDLETAMKNIAQPLYKEKVAVGCEVSKNIGNTYTASVYMNLANLISTLGSSLIGKSVVLFSYGSGALASMLQIYPNNESNNTRFSLELMQKNLNVLDRLTQRELMTPTDLIKALNAREHSHGFVPFKPTFSINKLSPGTFYLKEITTSYERIYDRKPLNAQHILGMSLLAIDDVVENENIANDSSDEPPMIEDTDHNHSRKSSSKASFSELPSTIIPAPPNHYSSPIRSKGGDFTRNKTQVWASGRPNVNVVVTGVSAALPGRNKEVFAPGVNNVHRIISGESFISPIPDSVKNLMIEKNVVELVKNRDGSMSKVPVKSYDQNINVCASLSESFSLSSYGVSESIVNTMDRAVQVAIAAGLEALKDARLVTGVGSGTSGWILPESMQNTTGIVYATSFPALDTTIAEVSKYFMSKSVEQQHVPEIISRLRTRLEKSVNHDNSLPTSVENALQELQNFFVSSSNGNVSAAAYEFDRKFLFRVLVLGNAQLAQIVKAKGPNMQTNAACAGATQAIALAYDMIQVGRAERMIVIAGDSASSDTLMPWLGNGFRILGAATTCATFEQASMPFNANRSGMILGSGGIGIILESEDGARRRHMLALSNGTLPASMLNTPPFKCRLLGTLLSNSAYHGASMDRKHIAEEMERFIASVEKEQGITRKEIATYGVYFSHETSTHASESQSCASNELYGLRLVFGEDIKHLLILNTKGFTGHPMGVSFEDVVAAEVLVSGLVPPIANFTSVDPALGSDLKLSQGGAYPCKYAMRFAAGFGSQIALALYGVAE